MSARTMEPRDAAPAAATAEDQPWTNRRATAQAVRAAYARHASGRRRFVDPTTCEREYTPEEMEFMHAVQEYKLRSGRPFPTWSEILEILRGLGYEKAGLPGADFGGAETSSRSCPEAG